MNVATVSSLKAFTCGAAALALTAIFSWSFVESTAVARASAPAAAVMLVGDTVVITAKRAAQVSVAALVD
jgi:hypothetical protein